MDYVPTRPARPSEGNPRCHADVEATLVRNHFQTTLPHRGTSIPLHPQAAVFRAHAKCLRAILRRRQCFVRRLVCGSRIYQSGDGSLSLLHSPIPLHSIQKKIDPPDLTASGPNCFVASFSPVYRTTSGGEKVKRLPKQGTRHPASSISSSSSES